MKPLTARELMSPRVMAVGRTDSLRDLVEFLRENKIHGAMVRESGRLVGVVSASDVLVYLADETVDAEYGFSHLFTSDGELPEQFAEHLTEATVDDIMTPAVYTLDADATAGAAARLMKEQGIHRLVVTEGGDAVGVLSATDLVTVVARYEEALAAPAN